MSRSITARPSRMNPRFRASVETLETRQVLSAMLGLTAANELAAFESTRPDVILSLRPITGLQPTESVLAIDSRPYTGQIYGLGSTGRLYTLDPATGAASMVGTGPLATPLSGAEFDIDFNPFTDVVRLVSDAGQDLRVNPDTGEVSVDPNLAYAPTDAGAGTTPSIVGAAYANNVPGGVTRLYEIDSKRGVLVTQGSADVFTNPAAENAGQLYTVGPLGLTTTGKVGFEVTPDGQFLASVPGAGGVGSSLVSINQNTGSASIIGAFPNTSTMRDITSRPRIELAYAVTTSNHLVSFRSSTPGTLLTDHVVLGLQIGETLQAIDFRPSTGQLYGFGSSGRLYLIDPSSAVATVVSATPISPPAVGSRYSIESDPSAELITFVTNAGQDLRIDPSNGLIQAPLPNLAYASSDPAAAFPPSVVAEAYSPNQPFGSLTSLYGIDSARDTLVLQGSINGSPVPVAAGQLYSVGPLGRDVTENAGFDVAGTGRAFVSLTDAGASTSSLYIINLATAKLTRLGEIAGGAIVRDIAIAPAGFAQFSATNYPVPTTASSATIVVNRIAGASGPVRIAYATSDGTARAGTDYLAVSGVLDFADGETVKTFTVPIRSGSFSEGTRTVNLSLSAVSGGVVIGPIGSSIVTIQSLGPVAVSGISSTAFLGTATAINAVDVVLSGTIDASRAGDLATYRVTGRLADFTARTFFVDLQSVTYDPSTQTAHIVFSRPVSLASFRSLQVTARGLGTNGRDLVDTYSVQRGTNIRFIDMDGDRVSLIVVGRRSKLVVLRHSDGGAVSAWVEGAGRSVSGLLLPRRGSNRRTTIDRFVMNGARLRLPRSITVTKVVTS
ncbi:MAG: hypothetical protein JWN86_2948 [Planctomycetota bacterium]|nr:hypothetical protein [Planctomycetota bacterium]